MQETGSTVREWLVVTTVVLVVSTVVSATMVVGCCLHLPPKYSETKYRKISLGNEFIRETSSNNWSVMSISVALAFQRCWDADTNMGNNSLFCTIYGCDNKGRERTEVEIPVNADCIVLEREGWIVLVDTYTKQVWCLYPCNGKIENMFGPIDVATIISELDWRMCTVSEKLGKRFPWSIETDHGNTGTGQR
jgi:hypothetical protein